MDIEIRQGLAEARALATGHWRALLAYIGLGVLVPFLLLSSEPIFDLRNIMAIAADPWTYRVSGSVTGPLYLLGIVSVIIAGAMLAAWNALLAPMREGYISEIMYGMVAGVAFMLASVAINLAIGFGLATIIWFTIGMEQWSALPQAVQFIPRVIGWTLTSWLGARICLAGPVMGERGKLDPLSAFAESWRATRIAQVRIFGLYFAFNMAAGAVLGLLIVLHGYLIINGEPGSLVERLMSGVWLIFWSLWFAVAILLPAGLYRASKPAAAAAEVFA
jgi:hypothetical protein